MPKRIEGIKDNIIESARARLLTGRLTLFSLRGIAEDCGIAVGTIYNYFRDKEEIMAHVMARDWVRERASASEKLKEAGSFADGILLICAAVRHFTSVYEKVWESSPTGATFGAHYRERHRMLTGQIGGGIAKLEERFGISLSEGQRILLADLILASTQEEGISAEDLLSFVRPLTGGK